MNLLELTRLSNKYGSNEQYVLAGGGNSSYKEDGLLFVKGSGVAMAHIKPEQFVGMDMGALMAMLTKQYPDDDAKRETMALEDMTAAKLPGQDGKRPSVEAILHALFPQKFVMHTHPALVNGLSCAKYGERACRDIFGGDVVWVPLTKPGYILARVCRDLFERHKAAAGRFPQMVILQNHGLFVAADTPGEIDRLSEWLMGKLSEKIFERADFSGLTFDSEQADVFSSKLRKIHPEAATVIFCTNKEVLEVASSEKRILELIAPFTPDHIVYCKHTPLVVEDAADIENKACQYIRLHGFPPRVVIVRELGFFALGVSGQEAQAAKALFLDAIMIALHTRAFGGVSPLPDDFTRFILDWEAETYRQKTLLG